MAESSAKKRPGLRGMEKIMSAEKYDLMGMPVVQTLQMIIDGLVVGDEAAGILRDAAAAQQLAEDVIGARRALIARAEQVLVYGKAGKPGAGNITVEPLSLISTQLSH